MPDFLTCTQRLQEWNKPRPRKVEPIPVLNLTARRKEILHRKNTVRPTPPEYDPRPISLREPGQLQLEKLRTDLFQLNRPCVLSQLLHAPVEVALHDHNYCATSVPNTVPSTVVNSVHVVQEKTRLCPCAVNKIDKSALFEEKSKMNVTYEQRRNIEERTRTQAKSTEWLAVRSRRITASKCGKILCQMKEL